MKKFIIALIFGLICFSSCTYTEYIMVQGTEAKLIEAKDDYHAYQSAFIDYCIGKGAYDAMSDPYMKNHFNNDKYDFILWKITYNNRFKKYVKREYNKRDNIYEIISHIMSYDYNKANKMVKKYNLSLNVIENKLSCEEIEKIVNDCYGHMYNTFSKFNN